MHSRHTYEIISQLRTIMVSVKVNLLNASRAG